MPIVEDNHRAKLHCNELLDMPLEMVFEMSQSLALVEQLRRIGHV